MNSKALVCMDLETLSIRFSADLSGVLLKKAFNYCRRIFSKLSPFSGMVYSYYDRTGECEFLSGCCLMLSRGTFEYLGGFDEVVIALNPTTFGDLAASVLIKEVSGLAPKITRLGRGIPTGGEIEFADEETLRGALEHRS